MQHVIPEIRLACEGLAGARFRKRRGLRDELLPWGTLAASTLPDSVVIDARRSFVEGAESELMTAIGFSELSSALMRASAPMALVGLASEFVCDELIHAELNARLAAELGATRAVFRREESSFAVDPNLSPLDQALELAVRVSCVGEALSVPLLGLAAKSSTHPLVRAVLKRIVRDEPAHAELGFFVLEWAKDRLDSARRARLGGVLLAELAKFADYFAERREPEAALRSAFAEVGFAKASDYERVVSKALADRVLAPLAAFGIGVDTTVLVGA